MTPKFTNEQTTNRTVGSKGNGGRRIRCSEVLAEQGLQGADRNGAAERDGGIFFHSCFFLIWGPYLSSLGRNRAFIQKATRKPMLLSLFFGGVPYFDTCPFRKALSLPRGKIVFGLLTNGPLRPICVDVQPICASGLNTVVISEMTGVG